MNSSNGELKELLIPSTLEPEPQLEVEGSTSRSYRPPQMFVIGKAVDLLQGATGKHTDGYTGYYWNEEG